MHEEVIQELRERYAERQALKACQSTSFAACLEAFGIPLTISVITPKGDILSISASDIYATRKKFFARRDIEQEQCRLTVMGDRAIDDYMQWLLQEHTTRYRSITSTEHLQWLKHVVSLIVARHLLEQKYALSLTAERPCFTDSWVFSEMHRLHILNTLPSQLAQLVHHIIRDGTQAQELLDRFHVDLDIRMRERPFALPEPLPPLPAGIRVPLLLPTSGEEPEHA